MRRKYTARHDLFGRLKSTRKRVIAERQLKILEALLESEMSNDALWQKVAHLYRDLGNPVRALTRDLNGLFALKAVDYDEERGILSARMEWPVEITETEFFKRLEQMPKAKTRIF